MTTFIRKIESHDPQFFGRTIGISGADDNFNPIETTVVHVPDTEVICNGCNGNVFPNPVFELFLSKRDLAQNHAYDVYCEKCIKERFPKAELVA